MNDFEIQRRLREMNAPRTPPIDLWPAIEKRIASEEHEVRLPMRRRTWPPLAAAAAVLFTVLGGVALLHRQGADSTPDFATLNANSFERVSPTDADLARRAPGGDPRLAGAAVVLDAAQIEIRQAISERPDAAFLVDLLNRTNARRSKLDRYGANAG
ncbi:hypothetical protein [Dokdonella sp.]|uniref:hypothetical protein n=1 Tax=Dokdonella sp. TaxID=2291710 RepID=UPI002622A7FE|nr:hypothetical protein [Dokdonella sp.]